MIDVPETEHQQRGPVAADGKSTDGGHRAWCSPEECYYSLGVQVHQQAPIRWEDQTAELRCETRLVDPVDDPNVYVELHLPNLRLTASQYHGILPVEVARRLRDQLTEHLDAVR